ncbi:MAG: hypothetical protein V7L20_23120 [Nostoc sp.]|uniref:hypothetical protein n=1 Tax=Nostoc sp. TaxID=1180 RepID=UPI002FF55695
MESKQTLNVNNVAANVGTKQRVEEFKTAMLKSWQGEAQVKGFADSIPSSFQGAIIESAKLSPQQKVIALTFDDGPWPESSAQVLDIHILFLVDPLTQACWVVFHGLV